MNDNFQIVLQAIFEKAGISKGISEIQNIAKKMPIELATKIDAASSLNDIKKISNELATDINKSLGTNITGNDLVNIFYKMRKEVAATTKEQEKLTQAMADGRKKAESLRKAKENNQVIKDLENEYAQRQKLTQSIDEQALKIRQLQTNGSIQLSLDKVEEQYNKLDKLGLVSDALRNKFDQLKITFNDFNPNLKSEDAVAGYEKLNLQLGLVKNSMNSIAATAPKAVKEVSDLRRITFENQVKSWIRLNSNAKEHIKQLEQMLPLIHSIDSAGFYDLENKYKELTSDAKAAGVMGKSLGDTLKNSTRKFGEWLAASGGIMTVINGIKNMGRAVYDIDTAMISLYKVTDETDNKYNHFLKSACLNAKELGRNVSSLVEQTAAWAKLGYSLNESAELAKVSSIYANVGEVDDSIAVSDLVTAMKAFNIEASNSINIVDSLNKLGNEFATDSASLGQGLKNSASALKLAGNDLNQTLAMLTGGTEIIQNASEMGNALKVLSMRLRGMKGELQELGEEYENVESISKIQTQILNQTQGDVNIFDDSGNFKSTYEILKQISEVWDHISQVDQAALLETIAGKQRGNQIAALIQSFQSGQVEKALEASMNSAGSAYEEQERWLNSLEAKTQQFSAAFQSLSNTMIESDFLKGIVDTGTGVVTVLDKIFQHMSALVPISATLIGFWQKDRSKKRFCPIWA